MKKLILSLVAVAMFSAVSFAEEGGIYLKWGKMEFTYPLSNASAISLYDWWKTEGLMGAETKIVSYNDFQLNVGAVTSFTANGTGFISLDYNFGAIIPNYPAFLAKIGIWAGRDMRSSENRAGIKAGTPLW